MDLCAARHNKNIPCDGEYVPSEGCCLRHACLFDIWMDEYDGYKVYATDYPKRWKRSKFHQWLNTLTLKRVKQMLESKG